MSKFDIEELTDGQLTKRAKVARVKVYSVMFTILLPMTLAIAFSYVFDKFVDLLDELASLLSKGLKKLGAALVHDKSPFRFFKRITKEANSLHAEVARRERLKRDSELLNGYSAGEVPDDEL